MVEWQNQSAEEAVRQVGSDPYAGLTQKEAEKRSAEQKNNLFAAKPQGSGAYARQMMAFLPILLLITAVAALLSEEKSAGYILLFTLFFCMGMLYAAYSKARRIMEQSAKAAIPSARVIRDGKLSVIPCEMVCRGDILLLEKGDFVPADCRLIVSQGLVMRENGITAKKLAPKDASYIARGEDILDSPNMIFAGTAVESGSCRAVAIAIGDSTHFASLYESKKGDGFERMPLLMKLKKLSAYVSVVLLAVMFLSSVLGFFPQVRGDFLENFVLACTYAAATMAEFYSIFAYITAGNALYSTEHRSRGALLKAPEALDAACAVDRIFLYPEWFRVPDSLKLVQVIDPFGEGGDPHMVTSTALKHLLRDGALSLGEWYGAAPLQADGKTGAQALKNAVKELVLEAESAEEAGYPFIGCGKTEKGLYYGLVLRGESLVITLTAPLDSLLSYGGYALRKGRLLPVDEELAVMLKEREARGEESILDAQRHVYAVAMGALAALPEDGMVSDEFLENELKERLVLEGFLIFEEALHRESIEALHTAREAGLGVSLFCENDSDLSLAKQLGLDLADEMIRGESGAFRQLSRKEKHEMLEKAKGIGEHTAFAGRDLSEVAHMKEASLAMTLGVWQESAPEEVTLEAGSFGKLLSANGCDAQRLSADLVVAPPQEDGTRGGFASVMEGLLRARSFFLNMRALMCYLVAVGGMKLVLMLATLFARTPFASAGLFALLGLVFDLGAAFAIILRPVTKSVLSYRYDLSDFFKSLLFAVIGGSLAGFAILTAALVASAVEREAFVAAALFAISFLTFLWQYAPGKGKLAGFGALFVALSLAVLIILVIMAGVESLLPLGIAVVVSAACIIGSSLLAKISKKKQTKA